MIYVILTALIASVAYLSYQLGRNRVLKEQQNGIIQQVQQANQARNSLSDPSVVEQLHQKYKR